MDLNPVLSGVCLGERDGCRLWIIAIVTERVGLANASVEKYIWAGASAVLCNMLARYT